FMFGGPEESPETVQKGIQNICSLDCSAVFVFMGIRILPDTELHEIAIDEGVIDRDTDLMEPVYYLSPKIDPDWLEETLEEAFAPLSHVLFPPDALDDKLQLLHKLGHAGALWDLLGPEGNG
ncbi:MAG: B12-binding domain-containing radical SAM protein, partial [Planctomycetota bacterium]